MWGRLVCVSLLGLASSVAGLSQVLPESVLQIIEKEAESGRKDIGELTSFLEYRIRNPSDLNHAGREELSALPQMTLFMVESLMDYRQKYGMILSWAELSLVPGFDTVSVQSLRPFLTLGSSVSGQAPDSLAQNLLRNDLLLRTRTVFRRKPRLPGHLPAGIFVRYSLSLNRRARFGFTLESDDGELEFPDFVSFHLHIRDIPLSRKRDFRVTDLVAGDYSLRFGQGLVLWNTFSMSGLSSPSSVVRGGREILPHTSSEENDFFHGCAFRLALENWNVSLFCSLSHLDARVEGNRFYTLPSDGLHDSPGDLKARNALKEYLAGTRLSYTGERFRCGLTFAAFRYDKQDARRIGEYDRFLHYDGWWGNLSADFLFSWRGLRFFGEAALDRKGSSGAVLGAVLPFSSSFEFSLLGRFYDVTFLAPHAGAFSTGTRCNNETGVSAVLRWVPLRRITIGFSADCAYHPHSRYGVNGPSSRFGLKMQGEWKISEEHRIDFRAALERDSGKELLRGRLRCGYFFENPSGFLLGTRGEISFLKDHTGLLFYQEAGYAASSGRFRIFLRGTIFRVDEWEGRIYCYERDLPRTFSVPAYYGRGAALCLTAVWKPLSRLSISAKWSGNLFSDHSEDLMRLKFQIVTAF